MHNLLEISFHNGDILANFGNFLCILNRMGGDLCNTVRFEQETIFINNIVLHLFKKPNEGHTLLNCQIAL